MGYEKLALFLLYALLCRLIFSASLPHLCSKDEALALLQFKQMFTINPDASTIYCGASYPTTLSWNRNRDCCSWEGVKCDENTGRVIELDLSCSQLQGKFHYNSSLFELSNLKRLNLSRNDFFESPFPPKFGEFSSLTHLDLSYSMFSGQIPSEISHLSKLYVLRIRGDYREELRLESRDFELLLKNLTQLRELELDYVSISSTFPLNFSSYLITLGLPSTQLYGTLPERVFHLPNLKSLDLSDNTQLTVGFPMTKWNSSTSLRELRLHGVNFTGNIPESVSYLTSLDELDMSSCNLSGSIAKPIWNLTHIEFLDLSNNQLEGPIPTWNFGNLKSLSLRNNSFNGPIASSVFSLSSLLRLDLRNNNFSGKIEEFKSKTLVLVDLGQNQLEGPIPKSLLNQQNLQFLRLSKNNLSGQIASTICNLKQMQLLDLGSNNLQGTIPECLGEMNNTQFLDLSNNNLSGQIAPTICNLKQMQLLDLGSNNLHGTIPECLGEMNNTEFLDLSNNNLRGQIASTICNLKLMQLLDLGSNNLQGTIPECLGEMDNSFVLDLSNNNLSGQIASTICNLKTQVLNLGSNNLQGTIPECLGDMNNTQFLDLSNNNLSGTIRANFNTGNFLTVIKLHGNKLEGKVPRSLINCKELVLLDLGNNELNDTFPKWLGILPNLRILNLRSNKLHGSIRVSRNRNLFPLLHILDLSSNAFSGNLPPGLFENLSAMKLIDENMSTPVSVGGRYYSVTITTKGLDLLFVQILATNIVIDLSMNEFKGQIPSSIGDLIGLRTLNLSHNGFEGLIPASLRHLSVLESLDLSFNKIGGGIPQQLTSLKSLEVLNLSHNHLVGCIPKGKQFDTFENSSYQGNDGLRGFPLSRGCGDDRVTQATSPDQGEEEEDSSMINWQAVLMGYGCGLIIGLSIIYIISTQNPLWFSRMIVELEQRIVTRMKNTRKDINMSVSSRISIDIID